LAPPYQKNYGLEAGKDGLNNKKGIKASIDRINAGSAKKEPANVFRTPI